MHMKYIFHNFRMTIFHDQKTLSLNFIITSLFLYIVSRKIFVEYLFLEYRFVSFDISVLANTITSQIFIIICLRELRFFLLLFALNLWSIAFSKTGRFLFICSFAARFQETRTSMTEPIFKKVTSCYFTKYKLHHRWLMSKFSDILMLTCRKIFSAFFPILHETFSNSCGFLYTYLGL